MRSSSLLAVAVAATLALTLSACSDHEHGPDDGHGDGHGSGDKKAHALGGEHGHGGHTYAVGEPADKDVDAKRVKVSMLDSMKFVFSPPLETLTDGEAIEFAITNDGKIPHEFSIGNAEEQVKHAEAMRQMPNMQHDDPNAVSLKPGESATLRWRFEGSDTVVFACNIPGHFEAGMHHNVAISN